MDLVQELEDIIPQIPRKIAFRYDWEAYELRIYGPRMERLFLPIRPNLSLCLHRLTHNPKFPEPYYHKHFSEMICKIVKGSYWMNVGTKKQKDGSHLLSRMFLPEGSIYTINQESYWHSVDVAPGDTVYTVLLMGKQLLNTRFRRNDPHELIPTERKVEIMNEFLAILEGK